MQEQHKQWLRGAEIAQQVGGRRNLLLEYAVKTDQIAQGPERPGEDLGSFSGLGLMLKGKPKSRSSLLRILALHPRPFRGCSPLAPPPARPARRRPVVMTTRRQRPPGSGL